MGINNYYSTVSNSYATGSVSGDGSRVGGLVGQNSYYASVSNSHSTGNVSGGKTYNGGLVGENYWCATVDYCYATGSVSGDLNSNGGLVGKNSSTSTVGYCLFDTETSGQSAGIGYDINSQTVTGLTTEKMKQSGNFTDWDSSTVWAFRADSTYPALRAVDNAPFAFADTLTGSVSALLTSDFDYETLKENLVYEIDSVYSITNSSAYSSLSEAGNNDSLLVRYRIGEYREDNGDTLWGNQAWDYLKLDNATPAVATDLDTSTAEDSALTLSLDWIANDADDDLLSYSAAAQNGSVTISGDSLTYTPDADWYGEDTVEVVVTDGNLSDTGFVHISVTAVNDAPALTAVATGLSMIQGASLTLDMDDVTATDVDNDAGDLSLVIYSGDDYTVAGTTITASSSFTGSLGVAVAVTDGQDTSNVDTLYVTVTQAASSSSSTAASSSSGDASSSSAVTSSSSSDAGSSSSAATESSSSSEGSTFTVASTNILSAQLNIRSVSGSLDIAYTISRSGNVDIAFYNVLGVKAHELHQGPQAVGTHNALGRVDLPAGRYIAVLRVDGVTQDRSSWIMH